MSVDIGNHSGHYEKNISIQMQLIHILHDIQYSQHYCWFIFTLLRVIYSHKQ